MAVSCMRHASGHNYRNSSFIVDVAMGQIPRSTEHIAGFCNNLPNCKPIQIISGRNIAEKIWNRLRHAILTFIRYALLVYIVKRHLFFSQFHNVKILISHFRHFQQ